jgi:hypothetical protein
MIKDDEIISSTGMRWIGNVMFVSGGVVWLISAFFSFSAAVASAGAAVVLICCFLLMKHSRLFGGSWFVFGFPCFALLASAVVLVGNAYHPWLFVPLCCLGAGLCFLAMSARLQENEGLPDA